MKILCRKYCSRELSEIEGSLNISVVDSVVDREELEHEDEAIKTRLDSAAAEMGLGNEQFIEEVKGDGGEKQITSDDIHSEDLKREPPQEQIGLRDAEPEATEGEECGA